MLAGHHAQETAQRSTPLRVFFVQIEHTVQRSVGADGGLARELDACESLPHEDCAKREA